MNTKNEFSILLDCSRWLDERNRVTVTRKWYAKTLPFPLGLFYPDRYQKVAEQTIEGLFPHIQDKSVLEAEVKQDNRYKQL